MLWLMVLLLADHPHQASSSAYSHGSEGGCVLCKCQAALGVCALSDLLKTVARELSQAVV